MTRSAQKAIRKRFIGLSRGTLPIYLLTFAAKLKASVWFLGSVAHGVLMTPDCSVVQSSTSHIKPSKEKRMHSRKEQS